MGERRGGRGKDRKRVEEISLSNLSIDTLDGVVYQQ